MKQGVLIALLALACRSPGPDARSSDAEGREPETAAERVVRQQYEAYNRHDVDAFVAAHAPGVKAYRYPDSLILQGRDALRERFSKLFAEAPQVHATVEARITQGDFVVWRETATGLPGGKTNTAVFVWQVQDGHITSIMAIR